MSPTTTRARPPASEPARAEARPQPPRAPSRSVAFRRRLGVLAAIVVVVSLAVGIASLGSVDEAVREVVLPLRHDDIIRQQAAEKDLPPELVAAVIYQESRFRPQTSPAGAEGLMQITPETAQFIAERSGGTRFELRDLDTAQINISYGAWYMRHLLDRYGGDETLAIAAYNAGGTNVDRWVAEAGGPEAFDPRKHIPFAETKAYVAGVSKREEQYRRFYGEELGL